MSILFVMAAKLFSSVCILVNLLLTIRPSIKETTLLSSRNATQEDFALVIELMRSNKIHENLMKNQAFDFFSVGEDYQRNVVENKNMVKGVITF